MKGGDETMKTQMLGYITQDMMAFSQARKAKFCRMAACAFTLGSMTLVLGQLQTQVFNLALKGIAE